MKKIHNKMMIVLMALVAGLSVAVAAQTIAIKKMQKEMLSEGQPENRLPSPESKIGPNLTAPDSMWTDLFKDDWFDLSLDDWDPFENTHSLRDRIDRMFDTAFDGFHGMDSGSLFDHGLSKPSFSPKVNLEEMDDHFRVTVELPDAENSKIDVKVDGQTLSISGSVESEQEDRKPGQMLKRSSKRSSFQHSVTLASPVDESKMTTENKQGVVTIKIPKKQ